MKTINVISLFDGISCGQLAITRAFPDLKFNYYASEIKKIATKVTRRHFPNTKFLGDVRKIRYNKEKGLLFSENGMFDVGEVFLFIGGSPCQDFSNIAWSNITKGGAKGLEGDKSSLFYEYLRLLNEIKPKYWLLENVNMSLNHRKQINTLLGVEPILIDSQLVSFQKRKRLYWTNIPKVTQPKDKNISFQDYKETSDEICDKYVLPKTRVRKRMWNEGKGKNSLHSCANVTHSTKIYTLNRKQDHSPNSGLVEHKGWCRFLTRKELEQAQTLPVGYTDILSYNQMQDVVGDGWTVDVISHILSFIPELQIYKT